MKFIWRGAKHSPFFGQQKNEVQQEVEHDVDAKQVLKGHDGAWRWKTSLTQAMTKVDAADAQAIEFCPIVFVIMT